jgi:hypothetical protein
MKLLKSMGKSVVFCTVCFALGYGMADFIIFCHEAGCGWVGVVSCLALMSVVCGVAHHKMTRTV